MKHSAEASSAYAQAIDELQSSISGFQSAKDSLDEAAIGISKIAKAHAQVVRSLGATDEKLQELLPGKFQKEIAQRQLDLDALVQAATHQLETMTTATGSARLAIVALQQTIETRGLSMERGMAQTSRQVVEGFVTGSKEVTSRMARDLKEELSTISVNVSDLSEQLETSTLTESLTQFSLSLDMATSEVAKASNSLTSTSEGLRVLLADLQDSVGTTLDEMSGTQTTIPRWGMYLIGVQGLVFLIVVVNLFV